MSSEAWAHTRQGNPALGNDRVLPLGWYLLGREHSGCSLRGYNQSSVGESADFGTITSQVSSSGELLPLDAGYRPVRIICR